MISANFAVAVVSVVLRGLVDKILAMTPVVKSPLIPPSTTFVLFSGILYLLYERLIKNRRIEVTYSSTSFCRRPRILDGCLHQKSSQSSSASNLTARKSWLPRRFRWRSRSRCRENLLQATKDSLQMLHRDCSSDTSTSSKSGLMLKCRCNDISVPQMVTNEDTPSVYSVKLASDHVVEKNNDQTENRNMGRFSCFGDCDWEERRPKPKPTPRRKRIRVTRKTRSGKIYSSYL